MTTKQPIVLQPERFKKLIDTLERLELAEAKGRMALEEANARIEQQDEIIAAIKDFASSYAEFTPAFEKIVKMCEE